MFYPTRQEIHLTRWASSRQSSYPFHKVCHSTANLGYLVVKRGFNYLNRQVEFHICYPSHLLASPSIYIVLAPLPALFYNK